MARGPGEFAKPRGYCQKNYASGRHVADKTVETVSMNPEDLGPFEPSQGREVN